jgi:hypothetical protein
MPALLGMRHALRHRVALQLSWRAASEADTGVSGEAVNIEYASGVAIQRQAERERLSDSTFCDSAFSIDYAKQLSNRILMINRQRLHDLDSLAMVEQVEPGHLSFRMMRVCQKWNDEVDLACHQMLQHMNETVAHFHKIANDCVAVLPGPYVVDKVLNR